MLQSGFRMQQTMATHFSLNFCVLLSTMFFLEFLWCFKHIFLLLQKCTDCASINDYVLLHTFYLVCFLFQSTFKFIAVHFCFRINMRTIICIKHTSYCTKHLSIFFPVNIIICFKHMKYVLQYKYLIATIVYMSCYNLLTFLYRYLIFITNFYVS